MKNQTAPAPLSKTLLSQARRFYDGLEGPHRRMLGGAIGVAVAGMIAVGIWAANVPYSTLISGRSHDDLMVAAAALEAAGIPYRFAQDGTILEVPKGSEGRARMVVDQQQEPGEASSVDYMQVGYTHQQQQWAFLRAREQELAKMINGFDPVEKSRVTVVPEEESLFVGERRPASAAVFVKLRPGQQLGAEQVRAITNVVASAVEGLTPDRVTLTDHRGRIYSSGADANSGAGIGADDLLEQRYQLQRLYEDRIRESLLQILRSPADFTVGVAVEVDHTSSEVRSRDVDPDDVVVLSEELNESSSQKTDAGGAPGVDANLPERVEEQGDSQGMQSSEKLRTRVNQDYSTVETTETRAPGDISRVSVAVAINQARVQAILSEFGEGAPSPEEFQARLQESIKAAVGYQQARGDVVQVSFTPFAELELVEETPNAFAAQAVNYLPYAIAALAIALTFAFVIRPLIQKVTSVKLPDPKAAENDAAKRERQEAEDRSLAERLRELVDNFEPVEASDLNRLVDHQAEAATQVLRDWTRSKAS